MCGGMHKKYINAACRFVAIYFGVPIRVIGYHMPVQTLLKTAVAMTALLCLALFLPQAEAASSAFITQVKAQRPDVKWDADSQIVEDFNGDGKLDFALLGYGKDNVSKDLAVVAVWLEKPGKKTDIQYLVFGIEAGRQDAVCAMPVKLSSEKFDCTNSDSNQRLPGCRKSKHARGLNLRGGDCDAIHLYLNHISQEMSWWRN